jgi:pyrroline-5-carboxylate reductase
MDGIPYLPYPTWLVGCGNMGGAMLKAWRGAGMDLGPITIIRPSGEAVEGVPAVTAFADAGPSPRLVVLAFKPQILGEVAGALAPFAGSQTLVVSLLAGVEAASLRARFPEAQAIIRIMPNLPISVRRGVVALFSDDVDEAGSQLLTELIAPLGFAIWANDEVKFATIGTVSGAGPAYVARFIAALAQAAEKRGISAATARTVALETVLGTAWMAAASGEDMATLASRVASRGGTTEAGLAVLDDEQVLDQLVDVAISAAEQRAGQLAEEAKSSSLAEPERLS